MPDVTPGTKMCFCRVRLNLSGAIATLANLHDAQSASKAETTRATHDTFMGMLWGPIATDHPLIILTRCMIATMAKINTETAAYEFDILISPHFTPARAILAEVVISKLWSAQWSASQNGNRFPAYLWTFHAAELSVGVAQRLGNQGGPSPIVQPPKGCGKEKVLPINKLELARAVVARRSEAVYARNYRVNIGDWMPRPNCCHDNVDVWVSETPQHKHVKGYLIFDFRMWGVWRVQPHSLVELEDGTLADITPRGTWRQYPFVRHVGSDEDFAEMANAMHVDVPA
jgi:hypothetical protein